MPYYGLKLRYRKTCFYRLLDKQSTGSARVRHLEGCIEQCNSYSSPLYVLVHVKVQQAQGIVLKHRSPVILRIYKHTACITIRAFKNCGQYIIIDAIQTGREAQNTVSQRAVSQAPIRTIKHSHWLVCMVIWG